MWVHSRCLWFDAKDKLSTENENNTVSRNLHFSYKFHTIMIALCFVALSNQTGFAVVNRFSVFSTCLFHHNFSFSSFWWCERTSRWIFSCSLELHIASTTKTINKRELLYRSGIELETKATTSAAESKWKIELADFFLSPNGVHWHSNEQSELKNQFVKYFLSTLWSKEFTTTMKRETFSMNKTELNSSFFVVCNLTELK